MEQWFGAVCIVAGCGWVGFSMALQYKREEAALMQLIRGLEFMICELEYRMTPLPELCQKVAQFSDGIVGKAFGAIASELEAGFAPDAEGCVRTALDSLNQMPKLCGQAMLQMGLSLGKFDAQGQRASLFQVQEECRERLRQLGEDRTNRLRCYRTLGLCAGAALAILFA